MAFLIAPTPSSPPPATDFTPLFTADWGTATGTSDAALLDSSGDGFDRFFSVSPLLEVVSSVPGNASPFSGNILRTEDSSTGGTGPGQGARNIEVSLYDSVRSGTFTPGEDWYLQMGYRIDSNGVSQVSHHDTTSVIGYRNLTWHTPETFGDIYRPVIRCEGGGLAYPFFRFIVRSSDALSLGVWYRHEYRLEIVGREGVDATRVGTNWSSTWGETGQVEFRIHPRIYSGTSNTLLIDASHYESLDFPSDGGRTLAQWYADGNTFVTSNSFVSTVDGNALENLYVFGLGNNGAEAGSGGIGDYWYYADFRVGRGGWPTET